MNRSILLAVALLLGAAPAAAAPAAESDLEIEAAWVRQPPPGASAAGYLTVHNRGKTLHTIEGARSDCCEGVEIHRTVVEDGVARMGPAGSIEVAPGGSVVFGPRGLHLMLIGPKPLAPGDTVALELIVDEGGPIPFEAPVRKEAEPDATDHSHHH